LKQFAAVTREDVMRVARRHLFPALSCLAASGPVKRADLARALHGAASKDGAASLDSATASPAQPLASA